ncbi:hypothetical protein L9F63_020151, partial [Diploptera punctata]
KAHRKRFTPFLRRACDSKILSPAHILTSHPRTASVNDEHANVFIKISGLQVSYDIILQHLSRSGYYSAYSEKHLIFLTLLDENLMSLPLGFNNAHVYYVFCVPAWCVS